MGRLHPEFHEPVLGNILNFILRIIDEIIQNHNKNPNKTINEFLEKYERKRKKIDHNFSEELINKDIISIINGIIESNEEYFRQVKENQKTKLIDCCINYFIEEFHDFYPNIEIKDLDKYIKRQYRSILYALNRLKSSQNSMIKLKRWLIAQLEDNWDLIESIWDDFNESKINTFEFLKNAMEILEEDLIYKTINYYPEIQEILLKKFG